MSDEAHELAALAMLANHALITREELARLVAQTEEAEATAQAGEWR